MSAAGNPVPKAALHLHSHFSLLRGVDSLDALLADATRAGYSAVALADVNGMYGAVPFYQSAKAAGLKPILGVELLIEPDEKHRGGQSSDGRDTPAGPPARLTLLARSAEGYRNLCRLTSLRQLAPARFDPVESVSRHREGLLVLCDQAELLKPLADRLGGGPDGPVFAELAPGATAAWRQRLRRLYAAAAEAGVPVAAALDSFFPDARQHDLHRLVTDIRLGSSSSPVRPEDYQSPARHLWSADAMGRFFARCPEAIVNANRIAEQCDDAVLELGTFHFPTNRVPSGETAFSYLHKLCAAGLRRRYRPVGPAAVSRLAYELAVIEKLNFADYFLFVHEIVSFARRRSIPVDVRGSAASSLVAYVLGFTQICPIRADLYFERFLHEGRTDCPDIDIDLCWRRRDEVIDFCYRRWGRQHVAMICTHQTMRARGAFVEVAKAMGLPASRAFALSRHIPDGIAGYLQRDWRQLAEARRNLPLDDPLFRRILAMAGRLEGAPRHLGIHCGGLVISPGPLTDYLPVQRAAKGIVVTQYEMHAVEAIGLVKMDLLGNRALSEVAEATRWATPRQSRIAEFGLQNGEPEIHIPQSAIHKANRKKSPRPGPDDIDPHDPRTADLVAAGDTLGVFQAESPGMRHLCRQLRVASQEDLTVALSVIRPGPANSGMKAAYVARHLGEQPTRYLHPKLAELIGRTHGVMIYQEDTMRVAVGIAGFSPAQADLLRQAVSKKRSRERMEALRQEFLARAVAHSPGLSPEEAAELWEQIAQFASYSFCRAHACVYGRIAWQTAWLKAHHPGPFYAALFNNHMGMYPMRVHVADAIRHGVTVLPPHVNHSEHDAILTDSPAPTIRLGLRFVRDLSAGAIEQIVRHRPFADLSALRRSCQLAEPELVNLIRCGACEGLGAERRALLAEAALEEPVGELLAGVPADPTSPGRQSGVISAPVRAGLVQAVRPPAAAGAERFGWVRPFSELEKLQAEIDVLGLFVSRHPMELISGDWVAADRLGEQVGRRVAVAGILDATRTTETRQGELMRFVTLEDASGLVECTFFPDAYRRLGHLFYHLGPFRVEGVVEDDHGAITVSADRAEPLIEHHPLSLPAELYPPSQIV